MLTYTVHEPPDPPADRIDRAESLVFVKDGFSWAAAVFGPLWMLAHRLWWPLLGYAIVSGIFELIKLATATNHRWVGLAMFALNLLVGMEAGALRNWTLERRGWQTLGSVSGRKLAECERHFFEGWLPNQPVIRPHPESRERDGAMRRAWGALRGARA
jgi:hypothetical protein